MSSDAVNGINGDKAMREVIALDCWHGPFGQDRTAHLRVHVSFKPGKFTTQSEFGNITFTVHLSEAKLSVIVPATEPIWIDPDEVHSGAPAFSIRQSIHSVESRSSALSGQGGVKLKGANLKPEIGTSAKGERANSYSKTTDAEIERGPIAVRPWHDRGTYSWLLSPATGTRLDGEPWARQQPVMKLRRTDSPTNRLATAIWDGGHHLGAIAAQHLVARHAAHLGRGKGGH